MKLHDLTFERSSGYAGYRCLCCGGWFYLRDVEWNDIGECKG